MNLFVISEDQRECAQMLDDRRVVKMTTETAQMLSDALAVHGANPFYKKCNPNHPCTLWVSTNRSNFLWALHLLNALNDEYNFRYQRELDHLAFRKAIIPCLKQMKCIPQGDRTPFQNSSLFKEEPDVFLAYRKTMIHKWSNFKREPRWTKRDRPSWSTEPSLLLTEQHPPFS
jgi:hypothetical protein